MTNNLSEGSKFLAPVRGLKGAITRHPGKVVLASLVLSVSIPQVRENIAGSINAIMPTVDNEFREFTHPGYLGNGQYGSPHTPPHGKEAYKKFATDPVHGDPALDAPGSYYGDNIETQGKPSAD